MAFQPNIGPGRRVAYVLLGAAMIFFAWLVPILRPPEAWALGVAGGLTVVTGAVGF